MMKPHDAVPLPDYLELPLSDMQRRIDAFQADLQRRHTVRSFSDRPVPRSIIESAIRAAGSAPSGANHQPWYFVAIGSPEAKAKLKALAEPEEGRFYGGKAGEEWLDALAPLGTDADKPYLTMAPWIIAIFGQRRGGVSSGEQRKNYYMPESVGIAMGFLIAALHQAGLAMLTHTPKPMDFLNQLCGRPVSEKPYLLLVVGYPAADATVPVHALRKKTLEEISAFI
ncbi:nitroreductase family protein [Sphingosinicella rhizophila]|uniref:Nitroreductase family protein n=1 Tax=Sphingosinicella rhizophila TaxID=3050082 RepID=A0ABU3Q9F4_9SPHN|nr:nitroreductase family protein [Sphingosinicella sp. GR2756]MDT9599575.1 nitroreductase family protein [Sphingosinicella sp. GR2756]